MRKIRCLLLTILLTTLVSCYRENIYDCYYNKNIRDCSRFSNGTKRNEYKTE